VTKCSPVEVVPRIHANCTEEIPVTINGTDAFVDPISYVIKSAGSPIHCNDVAPPRYKVGGKWYCSYPELKECHDPAMLPVDEVKIDPVEVSDIELGKSIYTKEQLDEFARFQDSQGTRKAYLAETAELAYTGRKENGEWGLALSSTAQGSLIDIVGASFFPLYKVVGPMIFFLSLVLLVWGAFRLMVTILIRIIVIVRCKGCGIWVMTALWGTLFQLAISPFSWMDAASGGSRRAGRPDDGERGGPRTGGGETPEEGPQHGGPQEEVLVVAEWQRQGASHPHRHGDHGWRRSGSTRHQEHQAVVM
jgi:hypothetical protein